MPNGNEEEEEDCICEFSELAKGDVELSAET
jgi:hypothetical protein